MSAPMVLDGQMTGAWFPAHVEHVLVATLSPGDVKILDSLPGGHRGAAAREAFGTLGARPR